MFKKRDRKKEARKQHVLGGDNEDDEIVEAVIFKAAGGASSAAIAVTPAEAASEANPQNVSVQQAKERSGLDFHFQGIASDGLSHPKDAATAISTPKAVNPTMVEVGPKKAPSHVRVNVRFDYQPDICKDYKETGYCGYGDNCIYLHDRGDYKSGWQLEKEWEAVQKSKKKKQKLSPSNDNLESAGHDPNSEKDPDGEKESSQLPFACLICRKPFESPVVTVCGHYFDEHCAMAHFKKSSKCYVCHKPTGGVFNVAKALIAQIDKQSANRASTSGS